MVLNRILIAIVLMFAIALNVAGLILSERVEALVVRFEAIERQVDDLEKLRTTVD